MRVDLGLGAPSSNRRRDPASRLLAAVEQLAAGQGTLLRHSQRPWASITFSGTRHEASYLFTGMEAVAAGEAFVASLPEHEFTIPRQLVADVQIKAVDHTLLPEPRLAVDIELLVLDEG